MEDKEVKCASVVDSNTLIASGVLSIELELTNSLNALSFGKPVAYLYSPVEYAYDMHSNFVNKHCTTTKKILFLGMNPGPWGMSQTGVPFGEVNVVKDWFGLSGIISRPRFEHPSRPVLGLACHRSEISGRKFWGLFQDISVEPQVFFKHSFVYNHCPVAFLSESGKNITPDELKAAQRKELLSLCDKALCNIVQLLQVEVVVGIGKFAEKRAQEALKGMTLLQIHSIPHPSPRNAAVKNWKEATISQLEVLNLMQYLCKNVSL